MRHCKPKTTKIKIKINKKINLGLNEIKIRQSALGV